MGLLSSGRLFEPGRGLIEIFLNQAFLCFKLLFKPFKIYITLNSRVRLSMMDIKKNVVTKPKKGKSSLMTTTETKKAIPTLTRKMKMAMPAFTQAIRMTLPYRKIHHVFLGKAPRHHQPKMCIAKANVKRPKPKSLSHLKSKSNRRGSWTGPASSSRCWWRIYRKITWRWWDSSTLHWNYPIIPSLKTNQPIRKACTLIILISQNQCRIGWRMKWRRIFLLIWKIYSIRRKSTCY